MSWLTGLNLYSWNSSGLTWFFFVFASWSLWYFLMKRADDEEESSSQKALSHDCFTARSAVFFLMRAEILIYGLWNIFFSPLRCHSLDSELPVQLNKKKGLWKNGCLICFTKSRLLAEVNNTERRNIFEMPLESTQQTLHSVLFLPLSWNNLMFHLAYSTKRPQLGVGLRGGVGATESRSGRLGNSYELSAPSSPSLFMHLFLLTRPPPPAPQNKHIRATQPGMESHNVDFS